jgi:DNA-binding transcriptional MerR regulator
MFTIGDFSRLARVSCRLLRYYDEIGLLRPATVDNATGYRYYSAGQLPRLNRILVLKELGFSLEDIGRFTDDAVAAAELRGMLLMRRSDIERALAAESERLKHIETRIAQLDSEAGLPVDDVVIRETASTRFVYIRDTVASFAAARSLLREVAEGARRLIPTASIGPLMAVAHAPEFEADCIDVQVGFALKHSLGLAIQLPGRGAMGMETLPAIPRMATCVRIGLPEHAHLVTARIATFVEANGYRLAGPGREVFLEPPSFERMEQSVVEMQFPIAKATSG